MAFSDSSWQDCPDTGISTGAYIIYYQGGPIDHGTHVPGPVAQSSAESEYNAACTAGMALAHLVHELLNEDPYMVTKEAPLIVLDSKYAMCMAKKGKDTKHTRHIARWMHFVRNGEKCKMHRIDWCEGGQQLADIGTMNVSEPDLTQRMKYIMLRLENWRQNTCTIGVIVYCIVIKNKNSELTRLDWAGIRLNQFEMFEESFKLISRWKQCGFKFETRVVWKPWINSENSKSLELTI